MYISIVAVTYCDAISAYAVSAAHCHLSVWSFCMFRVLRLRPSVVKSHIPSVATETPITENHVIVNICAIRSVNVCCVQRYDIFLKKRQESRFIFAFCVCVLNVFVFSFDWQYFVTAYLMVKNCNEYMAKPTIFQRLTNVFSDTPVVSKTVNQYGIDGSDIILRTTDKSEFEQQSLEHRQQNLLARQWRRATYDISNRQLAGLNDVKMMYRDCDLMDTFPEIGAALDIFSEEATYIPRGGAMVNVTSRSDRVASILRDLLVNRLSINTILPMVCRSMCKYGNTFMFLNTDKDNGVMGWKQLPVYEIERYENGMSNAYSSPQVDVNAINPDKQMTTKFVWVGEREYIPYQNWQVAHFRLLYDSLYLPYGMSALNKGRRHFRMLSMMEDMMLLYRLERSVERRVFKINVGMIDDQDVPAYVQQIADNFKRTQIVDPLTGQLDLRKNILSQMDDFFIPVRDDAAPTPIDTLPAAQNMTAMDDIKFVQNKLMAALRVPKSFLNFEDEKGDGKNLSILDVRFTRTVNRIQQALLMELNKICIIHLYLLGFTDDLTNFTLTMNNPSSQADMLELENLAKKISTAKDAVSDAGNGIPVYSLTRAWREILGWSDKEIEDNLENLRLEKALGAELERTSQIIKRTRIFDPVDNVYGEPGAEYVADDSQGGGEEGGGGFGGGGFGGGGFGGGGFGGGGGEFDFGEEGDMGDEMGSAADMDMGMAADENSAGPDVAPPPGGPEGAPQEALRRSLENVLNEQKRIQAELVERSKRFKSIVSERKTGVAENAERINEKFLLNSELNDVARELGDAIK